MHTFLSPIYTRSDAVIDHESFGVVLVGTAGDEMNTGSIL